MFFARHELSPLKNAGHGDVVAKLKRLQHHRLLELAFPHDCLDPLVLIIDSIGLQGIALDFRNLLSCGARLLDEDPIAQLCWVEHSFRRDKVSVEAIDLLSDVMEQVLLELLV